MARKSGIKVTLESNLKGQKKEIKERAILASKGVGFFLEGEAALLAPVDLGDLRQGMFSVIEGVSTSKPKLLVGNSVVYGPTHEFGDKGRNIKAQPFLRPSINQNRQQVQAVAQSIFAGFDKNQVSRLEMISEGNKRSKRRK